MWKKKKKMQAKPKHFGAPWWNITMISLPLLPWADSKQQAQDSINKTEESRHFAKGIWLFEICKEAKFAYFSVRRNLKTSFPLPQHLWLVEVRIPERADTSQLCLAWSSCAGLYQMCLGFTKYPTQELPYHNM